LTKKKGPDPQQGGNRQIGGWGGCVVKGNGNARKLEGAGEMIKSSNAK